MSTDTDTAAASAAPRPSTAAVNASAPDAPPADPYAAQYDLPSIGDTSDAMRLGRSVRDGYARGWGLQFTELRDRIRHDRLYQDACALANGRTVVTEDNRMNLFLLLRFFLPRLGRGHVVEFGTYRGGNALFMAHVLAYTMPGAKVYAFDTFAGMPPTDAAIDAHGEGDFNDVSLDELRAFAADSGVTNIEFVQGLFQDTAPDVLPRVGEIALAHIDCDILSAVAYSYEATKPFMVPGGYWVFDDALVSSCLGATEAVESLLIRRDGLNSEQIFPHFVFRAPPVTR
jgi:hypothetical protein